MARIEILGGNVSVLIDELDGTVFVPSEIIMTSEARRISEIIMDFVLTFIISNIGVVTNILVIIVFAQQGFKGGVKISMTTIAVWDWLKCLAASVQRIAGPMSSWSEPDVESWTSIGVVVFNYLICYSSYVTSVLAAYVAVERCLCVCMPFKVKWVLTPKVVLGVSLGISFIMLGLFVIMWGVYDIVWVYNRKYNQTMTVYINSKFYIDNESPLFQYFILSGILWPLISFLVIVVCSLIIAYKLRQGFKCRSFGQQLSSRDKQVVKMLLVIVGVYVVSLFPRIFHYLAEHIVHEFYFFRLYHNFFVFICYFLWFFDILNGACNFFVFFAMSSSFRRTFYELFRKRKPAKSNNNTQTSDIDATY